MKLKNYLRIGLFLSGFLLLNHFLGDWFVAWSRAESKDGITIRDFEAVQGELSFVVLGDSHPKEGFMAAKIPHGYNFSSSAESYIVTYYKLKYYFERGDFHPDVALVPIDLHNFSSVRLDVLLSKDPAYWKQYVNYLQYGWETNQLQTMPETFLQSRFALLGGLDVCLEEIFNPSQLTLVAGFMSSEGKFSENSLDIREERIQRKVDSQFKGYDYMDETLVMYFLRVIDLLEEYDVTPVLVYYPITEGYFEGASLYVPVEDHIANVQDLLEEDPSVVLLDYHDLYFHHLEYFSDPDHLNIWGAEIFTEQVIEDLENINLLTVEEVGGKSEVLFAESGRKLTKQIDCLTGVFPAISFMKDLV